MSEALPALAFGEINSDRKSTRLNSSHLVISYAVFCLKKKKKINVCLRMVQLPVIFISMLFSLCVHFFKLSLILIFVVLHDISISSLVCLLHVFVVIVC